MSLKETDFTGPWVRPRTGRKYESFGSWFAGDKPIDSEFAALSPAAQALYFKMLTAELSKPSFFGKVFKHAEGS